MYLNENNLNNTNYNIKDFDILDTNSLNEVIKKNKINLKEKIHLFRKLNKIITFNEDLKISQINNLFFVTVLKDINSIFYLDNCNNDENNKNDKVLYLKLFLMYLYNISNSDSLDKKKLFTEIFQNHLHISIKSPICNNHIHQLHPL